LWTGRVLCILGNTLAVGLAVLLVRRIIPERPSLAWLTGLGLAFNHIWCRIAPFVLTDNLFYPLLLGLFLLMLRLREKTTWGTGMAFGLVWGLAYLTRDIGLYCGASIFLLLMGWTLWKTRGIGPRLSALIRLSLPALAVLLAIVGFWVYCLYQTFGIISLGEGPRFYIEGGMRFSFAKKFDIDSSSMRYEDGAVAVFRLRPFEMMEYTRFPQPGDKRYPPAPSLVIFSAPKAVVKKMGESLSFALKEFRLVTLAGFMTLLIMPLLAWRGIISLNAPTILLWGAFCAVLGLHLLGPVVEARHIGWFFPWLYLGLAALTLWLWKGLRTRPGLQRFIWPGSILIVVLFCYPILYPPYTKEVPKRWQQRLFPNAHQLAAEYILKTSGPGAVISSKEPEVVYRSRGFWISQPEGTSADLMEWLYLGKADYLLLRRNPATDEVQRVLWADPAVIKDHYPELELVADFNPVPNPAYGKWARLFRFHPQPSKFAQYRERYPWAGTHPRETFSPGVNRQKLRQE
jgi:hypothetical protein